MKWLQVVCFFLRLFARKCPVCQLRPEFEERYTLPKSVYVICPTCRMRCLGATPRAAVDSWNEMVRDWEPTR